MICPVENVKNSYAQSSIDYNLTDSLKSWTDASLFRVLDTPNHRVLNYSCSLVYDIKPLQMPYDLTLIIEGT